MTQHATMLRFGLLCVFALMIAVPSAIVRLTLHNVTWADASMAQTIVGLACMFVAPLGISAFFGVLAAWAARHERANMTPRDTLAHRETP